MEKELRKELRMIRILKDKLEKKTDDDAQIEGVDILPNLLSLSMLEGQMIGMRRALHILRKEKR